MANANLINQAEAFGQVFLLAQHLTRVTDSELRPLGLTTSQWLLLAVVSRHPGGAPTLTDAAAAYGTSRQNVKQVAKQLEVRGYLKLKADPGDGRALRLHVTRKVADSFDSPAAKLRERRHFKRLFQGLGDADVAGLEALLRRWLTPFLNPGRAS